MTFREIQLDVFRRLNKATAPDPQTEERIKSFINQWHRKLLTRPGLDQLRHGTTTLASVSGTARVALAQAINRIDAVFDTAQDWRLMEKPLGWLRSVDPQQTSGTPSVYVPVGYEYVSVQPTAASQIWVKSTSSADVGILRVVGRDSSGDLIEGNITMTGVTAVQVGSSSDWVAVDKVFVSQAAAGVISLKEDSGTGTTLAQISVGRVRPYYFVLLLWQTPSAVITYTVDFERQITDMVEDTDEPYLPLDFHDLLSMGARADEYEKIDDGRFKTAIGEFEQRFKDLQYFLQGRASSRIIPRGMRGSVGWNNVGPAFPADFLL